MNEEFSIPIFRSKWYPTADDEGAYVYDFTTGKSWDSATIKGTLQIQSFGTRKMMGRILNEEGSPITEFKLLNKFWKKVMLISST